VSGARTRSIVIASCALAISNRHSVTVNGETKEMLVDTPIEATDAQIEVLDHAGIKWAPAPADAADANVDRNGDTVSPTDVAVVTETVDGSEPAPGIEPVEVPTDVAVFATSEGGTESAAQELLRTEGLLTSDGVAPVGEPAPAETKPAAPARKRAPAKPKKATVN
jgi:hypothetical protein